MSNKPAFALPTMKEIANIEKNGLRVASLFSGCGGSSLGYKLAGCDVIYAVEFVPEAIAAYRANHPNTYLDIRDVREVQAQDILNQVGEIDILDGSPPCFPAGTQIITLQSKKSVEFLAVGDIVLTHKGEYRRVTEVHNRCYLGKLVELSFKYGRDNVVCTPEHPLWVRKRVAKTRDCLKNGKLKKNGSQYKSYLPPQWVKAIDVRPGDVILEPHVREQELYLPKVINKQRINISGISGIQESQMRLIKSDVDLDWLNDDFAWCLGLYLAEGHTRGVEPILEKDRPCRREVIFSVAHHEVMDVTAQLIAAGLKPNAQPHSQGASRVTVTNADFWTFVQIFGKYAHDKQIPEALMTMPLSWQKSLLDGYVYGDGHIKAKDDVCTVSTATTSKQLAIDIARIVANVYGVVASIGLTHKAGKTWIQGRQVNIKDCYRVLFNIGDTGRTKPGFVDEEGAWIPVKDIKIIEPSEPTTVYNCEVEEHNSYTANGFAVHNCQSFSTAGARSKGWGKTKKYSGDVSQRSDDLFFEYARILKDLQPKAFIAENVSGLVKGAAKGYFLDIIEALRNCGYRVKASVLDAQWLGVPQMRQRLFYVGFRNDLGLEPVFPSPLKYHYTVKDVLPHIKLVKFSGKANNYKAAGLNASPTIMANDYERKETAYFSGGGWIETMQGERRQFTIDELKIICTFPSDFYLPGSFSEQWERLGRAVPPFLMRALATVVSNQLLKVSIHA